MKLKSVGISDFTCPVRIREKGGGRQETIATITLRATMPHALRRSCVAVFSSVLNRYHRDMSNAVFPDLLAEVRDSLEAESALLEMRFPYFIAKKAPVSGTVSLMEYHCRFAATTGADEKTALSVAVPVTTLCPCSKEISLAGAHNQRAEVELTVRPTGFIWMEDLIRLVEGCASCELFALLKRPDEKYVTETAYANPMFVEDVVRKVALAALARPDLKWFSVGVESFESIHKHSAYAFVDSDEID